MDQFIVGCLQNLVVVECDDDKRGALLNITRWNEFKKIHFHFITSQIFFLSFSEIINTFLKKFNQVAYFFGKDKFPLLYFPIFSNSQWKSFEWWKFLLFSFSQDMIDIMMAKQKKPRPWTRRGYVDWSVTLGDDEWHDLEFDNDHEWVKGVALRLRQHSVNRMLFDNWFKNMKFWPRTTTK